jgi:hypothetical protein
MKSNRLISLPLKANKHTVFAALLRNLSQSQNNHISIPNDRAAENDRCIFPTSADISSEDSSVARMTG